eukprot:1134409-Pelagomonas_calceolata.AAC.5
MKLLRGTSSALHRARSGDTCCLLGNEFPTSVGLSAWPRDFNIISACISSWTAVLRGKSKQECAFCTGGKRKQHPC